MATNLSKHPQAVVQNRCSSCIPRDCYGSLSALVSDVSTDMPTGEVGIRWVGCVGSKWRRHCQPPRSGSEAIPYKPTSCQRDPVPLLFLRSFLPLHLFIRTCIIPSDLLRSSSTSLTAQTRLYPLTRQLLIGHHAARLVRARHHPPMCRNHLRRAARLGFVFVTASQCPPVRGPSTATVCVPIA